MKDINLFPSKDSIFLKKIKSKKELIKDDNCDGYLIESSESEARKIIESLKKTGKIIALMGGDDAFNRRALETLKINYLVSPENGNRKDVLKQRDSGFNHVVGKLAKEKGVVIIVDMNEIKKLDVQKRAERIGRIIQNVKICRKAGCQIKIASLAEREKDVFAELDRKSFGVSLGMSSVQVRDCVRF